MTPAPRTVGEALREAERALHAAGVEESVADARLLLARALGASPTWIFGHGGDPLDERDWEATTRLLERRCRREPVQHLLGEQEFWSLRFEVGPDVLVPRPETELLVEAALEAARDRPRLRVADVGTGSGAVAIAVASELPFARICGTDSSPAALAIASRNARALGFEDRVEWREGHLVAPLRGLEPFDVLLANLPYVSGGEWEGLQPEVRDFEPRSALVGGPGGDELILELVGAAPEVLAAGALVALEVGHEQAARVRVALSTRGFEDVRSRRDLAGVDRVVEGRWKG